MKKVWPTNAGRLNNFLSHCYYTYSTRLTTGCNIFSGYWTTQCNVYIESSHNWCKGIPQMPPCPSKKQTKIWSEKVMHEITWKWWGGWTPQCPPPHPTLPPLPGIYSQGNILHVSLPGAMLVSKWINYDVEIDEMESRYELDRIANLVRHTQNMEAAGAPTAEETTNYISDPVRCLKVLEGIRKVVFVNLRFTGKTNNSMDNSFINKASVKM